MEKLVDDCYALSQQLEPVGSLLIHQLLQKLAAGKGVRGKALTRLCKLPKFHCSEYHCCKEPY